MALKNLFTIILLMILVQAKSQTPNWVWARSPILGSGSQALGEGWRNSTDALGNNNIVGYFRDTLIFGTDTLINGNTNNFTDAFIARYNSNGTIMWAKSSTGNGNAFCNSTASDQNGNSYIAGFLNVGPIIFDTITINSSGTGTTMFIVKYDSLGNVAWGRSFGAAGVVTLENIATDALGNVYATGFFSSPTVSFDSFVLTNTDASQLTTDFFLVKFDSSGTVLWAETGIGMGVEYGIGVATDANNNVYITGSYSSTQFIIGTDTLNNHSSQNTHDDIFLLKYDSNGNLIWAKGAGGIAQDYPVALAINAIGDAFITGFFNSPTIIFGPSTLSNISIYNTFILNYSSNGNTGWGKSQSSGGGIGRSIATDNCGNVFVIGGMVDDTIIFDSTILSLDSAYIDNMFMIRLNYAGNVIWGTALPFGGDDAISIVCDDFDNAYIGGDIYPPFAIIGNDTLINTGEETPFQAKLHFLCSVGIAELQNNSESYLFPNPFNKELNIRVNFNGESEIILYDITGRKLLQQKFTTATTLNTRQLSQGIYIYQVINKEGTIGEGKVVKD